MTYPATRMKLRFITEALPQDRLDEANKIYRLKSMLRNTQTKVYVTK